MGKSQSTAADIALEYDDESRSGGKTIAALKELITLIKTNATSYMMYFALVVIMLV